MFITLIYDLYNKFSGKHHLLEKTLNSLRSNAGFKEGEVTSNSVLRLILSLELDFELRVKAVAYLAFLPSGVVVEFAVFPPINTCSRRSGVPLGMLLGENVLNLSLFFKI